MTDVPFVERIFRSGDDVIAARFLHPTLEPGGEYQCRWMILWPDRVQQRYACGVDGIQALMLALKTVHAELMDSDLYKSGTLTLHDQHDLDLPLGWGEGPLYIPPERNGH